MIARRSPRCELTQGQGRACMYVCRRFACPSRYVQAVSTFHARGGTPVCGNVALYGWVTHACTDEKRRSTGRGQISVKLANTQPCLSINFFLLHVVLSFLFGGNCM